MSILDAKDPQSWQIGFEDGVKFCANNILPNINKNEWISVDSKLPKDGSYLLLSDGYQITMGWLNHARKEFIQCNTWKTLTDSVKYWMPIPEAPNE